MKRGENKGKRLLGTMTTFLVLVLLLGVFCLSCNYLPWGKKKTEKQKPIPKIDLSTEYEKKLSLGVYHNQEQLIILNLSSREVVRAKVTVSIPNITRKQTKTLTLTDVTEELKMKPSLSKGVLDELETAKDTHIEVKIVDLQGEMLYETTKKIKVLPARDMIWISSDGSDLSFNLASWVTPESTEVQRLVNLAANNTPFRGMVGYQGVGGMSRRQVTQAQVEAIFETMTTGMRVKYVSTPVSCSGGAVQRIRLPKDVLTQKSGNCIDLAVTVASALEATGMKPYIVLTTNHAFIAVKTWPNQVDYVYLECTAIGASPSQAVAAGQQAWDQAQEEEVCTVVDIAQARKQGIKPMK